MSLIIIMNYDFEMVLDVFGCVIFIGLKMKFQNNRMDKFYGSSEC